MYNDRHKTAAYKIIPTASGNIYQFFCERSGRLVCTTKPYVNKMPGMELRCAWRTEGEKCFNRCRKCGRWVDSVMYNPDVLMCVECAPIEAVPEYCPHCGTKAAPHATVCENCGKKLMYGGYDINDSV